MENTSLCFAITSPDTPVRTWVWIALGVVACLFVNAAIISPMLTRKRTKDMSIDEQREKFVRDLHSGHILPQGFLELDPDEYSKITLQEAKEIAQQEGYVRYPYGNRAYWRFRPLGGDGKE